MPYFDIPGQTRFPATSPIDCQNHCKEYTGCTNFIYFEKKCWLKSGFKELTFREGYVWGPKDCGRYSEICFKPKYILGCLLFINECV